MSWYEYLNPVRWFVDGVEQADQNPHKQVHLCSGCRREGHNIRTCQDLAQILDRLDVVERELTAERQRSAGLSIQNQSLMAECERLRERLARYTGAMAVDSGKGWR